MNMDDLRQKWQDTRARVREEKEAEPPVTRTPGVVGGEPCIRGTRIPVRCLNGLTEAEVLDCWSYLEPGLVREVLAWMEENRSEVNAIVERYRELWAAHYRQTGG